MMKKNELIEALAQGCHIYMDDQSRRAIVYSMTDERLDSCRYDTAKNLARLGGYDVVSLGAWSFARRIENTEARQAARQAAAEELASIRTPGHIEIQAKNDCWIGNNRVTKGRRYIITVYGDGTQEQPGNAYGSLYDFRTHEHAIYFEILSRPEAAQEEPEEEKTMKKDYWIEGVTLATAAEAMAAHRQGKNVVVWYHDGHTLTITGAAQKPARTAEDENRATCRRIAQEIDAYADGGVYRCPDCGEILHLPDDVGDRYRCPHCETVNDVDDLEQLGIWDFLSDVFDVEYRCGSDREYRSVRVMVACGGPNIYLDSASKDVELYWWSERARYPMSYEAAEALDQWAEDYWNM